MGFYATTSENEMAAILPRMAKSAYPRFSSAVSGCRYLTPELGRWTQRDPSGELAFVYASSLGGILDSISESNPDVYSFLGNDPVDEIDLLGLLISEKCRTILDCQEQCFLDWSGCVKDGQKGCMFAVLLGPEALALCEATVFAVCGAELSGCYLGCEFAF